MSILGTPCASTVKGICHFQVFILGVFALDLWLETRSKPYLVIHKPEVVGVWIQTKFQIKFVSASLRLNDKTAPQGII